MSSCGILGPGYSLNHNTCSFQDGTSKSRHRWGVGSGVILPSATEGVTQLVTYSALSGPFTLVPSRAALLKASSHKVKRMTQKDMELRQGFSGRSGEPMGMGASEGKGMSVARMHYVHVGNCQRTHSFCRKKKRNLPIFPTHEEDNFSLLRLKGENQPNLLPQPLRMLRKNQNKFNVQATD